MRQQEEGNTPYLPVFDGFRGLAVLAVLLSHVAYATDWTPTAEPLAALRSASYLTPEFLFTVSGFVLFLPVAHRGYFGSKAAFAIRRAGRIVPAYLMSLVATVIVAIILGHPPLPMDVTPAVLAHLVFLQHPLDVSGLGVNPVYWTISILFAFYLLLPFVGERFVKHPLTGFLIAIVIAIVWRSVTYGHLSYSMAITFPLFVVDFAAGMVAASLFVFLRQSNPTRPGSLSTVVYTVVSAAAIVGLMYGVGIERLRGEIFFYGHSTAFAIAIPTAFGLFMVAVSRAPRWVQWPLSNPVATFSGRISYGVLLYHLLVLHLILEMSGEKTGLTGFLTLSVAVLIPSVVIGWLSHRYLEWPIRERVRKFTKRSGSSLQVMSPRALERSSAG